MPEMCLPMSRPTHRGPDRIARPAVIAGRLRRFTDYRLDGWNGLLLPVGPGLADAIGQLLRC